MVNPTEAGKPTVMDQLVIKRHITEMKPDLRPYADPYASRLKIEFSGRLPKAERNLTHSERRALREEHRIGPRIGNGVTAEHVIFETR